MGTAQAFITELAAKIEGEGANLTGTPTIERLAQDYDLFSNTTTAWTNVATGTIGYKIRAHYVDDPVISSNENAYALECVVDVLGRVNLYENERFYTEAPALELQRILLVRQWWRDMTNVRSFWENGVLQIPDGITRVGKVYVFTLTAQIFLTP